MKLKMCPTGKVFGKICLKAIRDRDGKDRVRHGRKECGEAWRKGGGLNFLMGSDIQQRCEVQNFGQEWEEPCLDPPLKHPKECTWSEYCNNSEKSKRESFLPKQQIYSM